MQTAFMQHARHGWNVVHDGFSYPFKNESTAVRFLHAIYLLDSQGLLTEILRFNIKYEKPDYIAYSSNYYRTNENVLDSVIAKARTRREEKRIAAFPSLLGGGITGTRTGRTCAGVFILDSTYARNGKSSAQTADRVVNVIKSRIPSMGLGKTAFFVSDLHLGHPKLRLNLDAVLGEKWPGDFKKFTPAYVPDAAPVQQASPAPKEVVSGVCAEPAPVVVESIDPRKIPLLHYVNAEFLPDAPKDDNDGSTEACWKRQARTIHGLLRDLEQRTKTLVQTSTELEISKTRVAELQGIVHRQADSISKQSSYIDALRSERDGYQGQVLKNLESIAVVKYSQRDHEWHLIKDGIAYKYFLGSEYVQALLALANSINIGRVTMTSPALIRKAYYYKEDYA